MDIWRQWDQCLQINQSVNKYKYKEINKYRHHVEEYEILSSDAFFKKKIKILLSHIKDDNKLK